MPVDSIVTPRTIVRISGEGMPIFTTRREDVDDDIPKRRGDLFVQFDISFPKRLNDDQR